MPKTDPIVKVLWKAVAVTLFAVAATAFVVYALH
jgi:hypothetical protein